MCGFAGFVDVARSNVTADQLHARVDAMCAPLLHRGPDDAGRWVDPEAALAFGFRRLSILDLSVDGHQPMTTHAGRYVLIFNGEIYNFDEIRRELDTATIVQWQGHSDTEVLLEAFAHWGIEKTLRRVNGMFAFAFWDAHERVLWLGRDRIGEKPLYYGRVGSTFAFGSELKAFRAHPEWRGEIDQDALASYLQFRYVPAPLSIYRNISKLEPGHFLRFDVSSPNPTPKIAAYWSPTDAVAAGTSTRIGVVSVEERLHTLETLLTDAVALRMVADVPLGAFLSGGVDSSLIVALMQTQSMRRVKTFSIGFEESGFDEASAARLVAQHLNTDHTEQRVSASDALGVIPELPLIYDEPFADSSQIATSLLAKMTRRHVTVALSGDAGDELFGGYNRYQWVARMMNTVGRLPHGLRRVFAASVRAISPSAWNTIFQTLSPIIPSRFAVTHAGEGMHKLASIATERDVDGIYRRLVSDWVPPKLPLRSALTRGNTSRELPQTPEALGDSERMMFRDLVTYLPDDILVKVDRATMWHSLEARVPFVDHRVIEFAWGVPLSLKIHEGQGKWLVRQLLQKHVPSKLTDRPKQGFSVPLSRWLRGPLKEWADDLLSEKRLNDGGFFTPSAIRSVWSSHLSGRVDAHHALWVILMFQAWFINVS